MSDTKISAMPAASALTGAELLAGVQSAANVKITAAQIKTLSVHVGIQQFTSSGTYTPTAGMLYCIVECLGGGGSGSYAKSVLTAAQIGASQVVTIGAGGTAGTSGNNAGSAGGDTSLGSLVIGKGGSGGGGSDGSSPGAGGAGGAAGTGTVLALGTYGSDAFGSGNTAVSRGLLGVGGRAPVFGAGFPALVAIGAGATGGPGYANSGNGGSGGFSWAAGGANAGGLGGSGRIVVTEFF